MTPDNSTIHKFFRNLSETRQIWIPFIILFIVLAPVLTFIEAFGNVNSYIFVYMTLSILLSIGIIYSVYKVTEISSEERFSQLISLWALFLMATIICIVLSDALTHFVSASQTGIIAALSLSAFVLSIYLVTFCIIFLFFILMLYLVLSFNFDTFFPLICVILIVGMALEYNQVVALGTINLVIILAIVFIIVFAIYSGLPENEKVAMRAIKLTPERSAVIYALALIVFFSTHLIMSGGQSINNGLFSAGIEAINIVTLAIILFILVFLCSLFWTKDAIVKWYKDSKHH